MSKDMLRHLKLKTSNKIITIVNRKTLAIVNPVRCVTTPTLGATKPGRKSTIGNINSGLNPLFTTFT